TSGLLLPTTGVYTIYIAPSGANTGSLTVNLIADAAATAPPSRAAGSVVDTGNPLSANLAGLFVMNEKTGANDLNLADGQSASFSGSSLPTWNTSDPSVVFGGGASQNSYLDAGSDPAFDALTTNKMTVVAKVYVATLAAAGICEKNDGNTT